MDQEASTVFCSDLMSDVLAEMMDFNCIVVARGKMPDETMIRLAEKNEICLMSSTLPMYNICAKLSDAGLKGGESDVSQYELPLRDIR
jgi:serine kinase of HPr protein (carbohydrate metabolism regulator)